MVQRVDGDAAPRAGPGQRRGDQRALEDPRSSPAAPAAPTTASSLRCRPASPARAWSVLASLTTAQPPDSGSTACPLGVALESMVARVARVKTATPPRARSTPERPPATAPPRGPVRWSPRGERPCRSRCDWCVALRAGPQQHRQTRAPCRSCRVFWRWSLHRVPWPRRTPAWARDRSNQRPRRGGSAQVSCPPVAPGADGPQGERPFHPFQGRPRGTQGSLSRMSSTAAAQTSAQSSRRMGGAWVRTAESGSAGRPRCSRMRLTTAGSSMQATTFIGPVQVRSVYVRHEHRRARRQR